MSYTQDEGTHMKSTVETWKGLIPGDIVTVTEAPGSYKFINATINAETGETLWVTVIGGRKGRSLTRMFTEERIVLPKEKALQKQRSNRGIATEGEGQ